MSRVLAALLVPLVVSGCGGSDRAHVSDRVKFSESAYGAAASPRVTKSRNVRRGGGRRHVGKPYKIRGRWYKPKLDPRYDRFGVASWYGPNFHGRKTANGEIYDQYSLSAAHPTMPLPSYARVTNVANGESTIVRVNDRGPYHGNRTIDLSGAAAARLKYRSTGIAKVRVQYIGPAPLHARDRKYLKRSHKRYDASKLQAVAAARTRKRAARRSLASRFLLSLQSGTPTTSAEQAVLNAANGTR